MFTNANHMLTIGLSIIIAIDCYYIRLQIKQDILPYWYIKWQLMKIREISIKIISIAT